MASRGERPTRTARPARGAPRGERSDLAARVLAALPAVAFAIFIVLEGGLVFVAGAVALGVLALAELYKLMGRVRPAGIAGFASLAAIALAAHYGGADRILVVLVIAFPVTFFLTLLRPRREFGSWAMAVTLFGTLWIGLGMAHAVLLRDLDHGGALLTDTLIGTFIGDSAAYFGGRAWGRRPLAPRISPKKTVEGLLAGIAGGTFAYWLFAFSYQDWYPGRYAILVGLSVALAAPVGDLFESFVKRDLGVKDTGRFFGAHGGVLDRLDAVLFTLVTSYYVVQALPIN
jgi:phosphatidate cytidylyltransferase